MEAAMAGTSSNAEGHCKILCARTRKTDALASTQACLRLQSWRTLFHFRAAARSLRHSKLEKNDSEPGEASPWTTVDAELLIEICLLLRFLKIMGFVQTNLFLPNLTNAIIEFVSG